MKSLLPILLLGSGLMAQSYTTSPAGYLSTDGGSYGYTSLGRYKDQHSQLIDNEFSGKVMNITEIALRLDDRTYSTYTSVGRSFSNVSLRVADGNYKSFGRDYSANAAKTPKLVFSGSVTWPTVTGAKSGSPWGGTNKEYSFPFSSPFLSLGQDAILTDWQFTGGTLSNGANWTSTSARSYYFDGYTSGSSTSNSGKGVYIPSTRLNNTSASVTGRCNDSAFGTWNTSGAYAYLTATVYNNNYTIHSYRNKLRIYSYSYRTAPDAPVIHAWAFKSDPTGIDLATGCNKLHLSGPMLTFTYKTLPFNVNTGGYTGYNDMLLPWNKAYAGLSIYAQAAWADSSTGKFNLSQAYCRTIASEMPSTEGIERAAVYNYNSAKSWSGPTWSNTANPLLRYTY